MRGCDESGTVPCRHASRIGGFRLLDRARQAGLAVSNSARHFDSRVSENPQHCQGQWKAAEPLCQVQGILDQGMPASLSVVVLGLLTSWSNAEAAAHVAAVAQGGGQQRQGQGEEGWGPGLGGAA